MRLVLAVVHSADVDALIRACTGEGIAVTQIEGDAAVGRNSLAAVIAGVEDEMVGVVIALVHATSRGRSRPVAPIRPIAERAEFWIPHPIEQVAGGASVYVIPIRQFERIGYA